ncbi:tetratricopeptide repeat protein [Caulobacter endophyticus]|uniref:tetratricopeptide repeat protein n=1 Tax=Caulobacter endophyticus TaxID=2172652 RepID=UPI00240FB698|nr:tetratricopeptide repeat protein [Caulobacter endophyticus]MDG2531829.1 tetratricopeptide repeat protein [Caulobacter endophyticus]
MLVTEKGMALTALKRHADALALYDGAFAHFSTLLISDDLSKARLMRSRGFSLIELGRLDEAEESYRASLEAEPDHAGAKHELDYIAKLRAGAQAMDVKIVTGAEAVKPQ